MGRLKLFDEDGDSSNDDISKIEINHDFAKRYEYNKKREELQKYEELKKQGLVDSSDSDSEASSSEEEELIKPSKRTDAEFFDALIKVKKQDPLLMDKDAKLFESDDEDEDEDDSSNAIEKNERKKKPMYLKDVVSKHLIEAGPEFSDEEMENAGNNNMESKVKSYSEEQEEFRREFLKAVNEDGNEEDGDLLTLKNNGNNDEEEEDDIGEKLDEYFGEDEKLDENMMFLKDYFRNRMWIDDGRSKCLGDDKEFSEDEEEIEKQEDYEREFNFRFEENVGDRIMGHSRKVDGSVRKKDNARKSQRERKEERMAQAELERKEELKRLKNLKKKEINEKLQKIREVAGIGNDESVFLDVDDLEEEFDPEAYDRKMKEAFDDGYYGADDADPEFGSDGDEDGLGLEKPDFDKENELLGLPKGWDDVDKSSEGFESARQRILKDKVIGYEYVGEEGDDEPKEGKRKRKRKPSEVEKAVREELMEEYYKLDYEDTIGDLKTRFKYRTVNPKRYGLTPEEIIMMDEKELNQHVSLKKLAPYREKEWKVPRPKIVQLIEKRKDLRKRGASNSVNGDGKGAKCEGKEVVNVVETERSQLAEPSKKSKRRRRQGELKLPHLRIVAYGKIPTKSKSKSH